ncbi:MULTISPECIES: efflux RND transporter periplasmic adaptor subunit [Halomonadaceae]|jgi:membrane fusion protein, multidrug efflux system|uniref:efflux RND transporter periplasmic adaptor subunit n=1 Tax=Halomonadaceae TaxID=28256 RepID=UPI0012F12D4F|nr:MULTISPECIES: efflux RND transporter periplasmic adaptor subunit [Halomonas]QNU62449.1 efflux RND transporter periplasmic adaptor subunit [Halomonas titanicae]CAD5270936.1 Acriflavin resistance protein AcrA [Halomonas sp. 156]CAD5279641.1 Acriflavin resistance protein AcrA [Halomonas sp. 113]CAD5281075.1 Acriflavin resistance protein AcrA [Halomonas sp. 59]CAD5287231.1 Acriflavin resistance protein AcrA [Halomonas sp. I3]|tara:strand:- start:1750 stop:2937 length:1188 start_codon:yes stop_codon:yes gene_type:complete
MGSLSLRTRFASSRAIFLFLLLMALLTGCEAKSEEAASASPPPPPEVEVAEVTAQPVVLSESFTGRVEAAETVELRSRVSGYIQEVAFEEGELVEQGDLLFLIDPRPYQARVNAAQADLAQARSQQAQAGSEAERARVLLGRQAISQEVHDQRQSALSNARAMVDAAEAALQTAELDLEYTRITAPVSGRVGRAMVTRGNLASADQSLLTTLVSIDPIHVYFEADEQAAFASQTLLTGEASNNLNIELGGDPQRQYKGTLDFIDNRLNPNTGTLQFRAVLDNPDGRIRPGEFARVEMPVARLDQALLVDGKAVLTDQDRRYVYVVDENNLAQRRQVDTGRRVDERTVISEGLAAGDRVIVNGVQKVFMPGMEVSPQTVPAAPAADAQPAIAARED